MKFPKHLSLITSRECLEILITNEDAKDTDVTSNVVYREVFCNVSLMWCCIII